MKLGEVVVHMGTTTSLVSSKLDEKPKSFNYRPFNGSVIRLGSIKVLLSGK